MNKLNKHFVLLIAMLGFGLVANAQAFRAAGGGGLRQPEQAVKQQERVVKQQARIVRKQNVVNPEILRIKKVYIARQLGLSPQQNAIFMHKFDEYQEDYNSIYALIFENKDDFNKKMAYIKQIYDVQIHYHDEFVKIMSPEKALKVFDLEKQFDLEAQRISKEKRNK